MRKILFTLFFLCISGCGLFREPEEEISEFCKNLFTEFGMLFEIQDLDTSKLFEHKAFGADGIIVQEHGYITCSVADLKSPYRDALCDLLAEASFDELIGGDILVSSDFEILDVGDGEKGMGVCMFAISRLIKGRYLVVWSVSFRGDYDEDSFATELAPEIDRLKRWISWIPDNLPRQD